jgi:hypothetical protein
MDIPFIFIFLLIYSNNYKIYFFRAIIILVKNIVLTRIKKRYINKKNILIKKNYKKIIETLIFFIFK